MKLTWADLPALLLAAVSAVTVTAGAQLLRGQGRPLMFALGAGVAGATFILDKLLVERLNAVTPRQSLVALLFCWLPLFLFATALATLATFSWIAPEVARRDLDQSRALHWSDEVRRVSNYLVAARIAVARTLDELQGGVDAERRRAADARRDGLDYSPDPLRAMQRKTAAAHDLEKRVAAARALPLERPADPSIADDLVNRVFADLADLHAGSLLVVSDPPPLPVYEPFSVPSTDLQSLLARETAERSWRAIDAWAAAFWVELLPVLALWRGGRKVPLAVRIAQWRRRGIDVAAAALGRGEAAPLPILIEPLQVRGVVRIALSGEFTLDDCSPLLEQAVDSLTGVLGSYRLQRMSTSAGEPLEMHRPLLPQLKGEPLVLSVAENFS
jgi:hypothetical protein